MRALLLGLLMAAVFLFGCTSATPYVPSSAATATLAASSNAGLTPLALPSLSATNPPAATPTPVSSATPTPAPTATPAPTSSCAITTTNLGYNQITGKQQFTVKTTFTNLPADVQLADVSCSPDVAGTPIEIKNNAVERICSYSNTNAQKPSTTAGAISCTTTIG